MTWPSCATGCARRWRSGTGAAECRSPPTGGSSLVLPWETRLFSNPLDGERVRREAERLSAEVAVVSEDPGPAGLRPLDRAADLRLRSPRRRRPAAGPAWAGATWARRPAPGGGGGPLRPPRPARCRPGPQKRPPGRPADRLHRHPAGHPGLRLRHRPPGHRHPGPPPWRPSGPPSPSGPGWIRRLWTPPAGRSPPAGWATTSRAAWRWRPPACPPPTNRAEATETVLFTNMLGQEITVPARTVVRTSAGAFPGPLRHHPGRDRPPFGQAPALIEALEEGPAGNVGAGLINQVEGVNALALRVINPEPARGGGLERGPRRLPGGYGPGPGAVDGPVAGGSLPGPAGVSGTGTEVLFRQSLEIQASEVSYDRFLYEQADKLQVCMKLLVTGCMAVDRDNAEAVGCTPWCAVSAPITSWWIPDFEIQELIGEPPERASFSSPSRRWAMRRRRWT